ncbi:MAG: carboxy terminal-processing peptidase [Chitinophagaceae bacterium]|nr:carboxy terminal-processing peptidase [Chitinophagaceae bacterium]
MKRILPALIFLLLFQNHYLYTQSSLQQKAIVLKRMIELNHLAPKPVDDSFSADMFKIIINRADRRRLLFTDAEFKSLQAYNNKLDEELNKKEWTFYDLFATLYKKALTRADSIITKLSQKPFDFNVNETVTSNKREEFNFATDVSSLSARWLRYLKYSALDQLFDIAAADTTGKTSLKTVIGTAEAKVREQLKKNEIKNLKRLTTQQGGIDGHITELYLNALASVFDPHTNYFSPQGKQQFQESLSTEALSFGLELDENEKGQIVVDMLTPGGPAWKSGDLNKGDILLSVLWEGKEVADMTGATLEEAYEELEKSSTDKLILKFKKADGTEKTVMLKKEKLENEENIVKGFVLQGEKKIGYILLPGFYTEWENESGSSCANDVAKEIVKLKKENIDGLILDVRYNGGGSLGEALEMTGIFIDEGPVVGIKSKDPKVVFLKDPNRGTIFSGPMVLMVNGQSASASEMLAAALQDYNRAVIVGSATFGKATMQQMFSLDTFSKKAAAMNTDRDMVKITDGKLYRLTGESAQRNGVVPDVLLPDAFDGIEYREKFSPNALVGDPVAKNNYYKPLPALPVNELAAKSALRIKSDDNFRDIQQIILMMIARREKSETISLKWEEFEKWARQNAKELEALKGDVVAAGKKFTVTNHGLDKVLLANNEYAREINQVWLDDINEDIYIQEAFLVLCDLIKLR